MGGTSSLGGPISPRSGRKFQDFPIRCLQQLLLVTGYSPWSEGSWGSFPAAEAA